ncbi:hypothetical protein TELCIR_00713 [Teladorsagia circumcincta]|uniref:TAF6 C-terminal HEAT repeat domain-containing protein n=1 Tax=Teladorsagia circumcincta TaxID=45464 RepID=A0A2G9V3Y4_TELCI|nr:hypothetical protein TELCIR_00713 [Teladorsagia circumcincta]
MIYFWVYATPFNSQCLEGRYKTGVDHSAWNHAYALSVIRHLGLRPDIFTEAAIDSVMSNVTQVVRDVLTTALLLVAQGKRIRLEARDIENSIDIRGILFACTSSRAPSNTQFRLSDSLNKTLYPNDYFMVDLRAIMNVTPRRMPFKRRIRKHWLVIEGEQPRVPENPVVMPSGANSGHEGIGTSQSPSSDSLMDQQVFFRKCVETIIGPCPEKRREVLHLLASDPGLQSLVPRFAVLIFEGVRCNIAEQNLPVLRNILRLLKTLIDNVQVNLDKCLHDIIPALCSCVVCKELCPDPEDKRHFRLREFAATILAMICKKLKEGEQRRGRAGEITNQNESSVQKRYPRVPRLPMRAPGIIRPTHASVTKLRMSKYSKRHEGGGLFRQSTSTPKPTQSSTDSAQHPGIPQSGQQHQNVMSQNVRGPAIHAPGPLPAVVVEPAFPPRRVPASVMGEQPRAHPAVTVEPAFPRRPQGPR